MKAKSSNGKAKPSRAVVGRRRGPALTVKSSNVNASVLQPIVSGMPKTKRVKLRYTTSFAMNSGAGSGSADEIVVRANGPYDPEYAVGGGQPNYFDEYAAIYGKYVVHGSTLRVTAFNLAAKPMDLAVYAQTSTSSVGSDDLYAQRLGSAMPVGAKGMCSDTGNLTLSTTTAEITGKRNIIDFKDLTSAVTSTPALGTLFFIQCVDQTGTGLDNYIHWSIDYDVEFFEQAPRDQDA